MSRRAVLALVVSLVAALGPACSADAAGAGRLDLVGRWSTPYAEVFGNASTEAFSSAAVGDVDGDGAPDVVVGGLDGHVRGYRTDGTRFLDVRTGAGAVQASPTLVDLTGDGVADVLTANTAGDVLVVTGKGHVAFAARNDCKNPPCGFFATPVAGDLDRDGQLEIVAVSFDQHVYAWNLDRTPVPGFPVFVYDTLWSSPALADLDADGFLEIVFGGDMDAYPGAPYPPGGLLWVLRHDGRPQPGFPRTIPGQVVWSSPAVTDLNGDGALDVVVGTGLNFPDPAGHLVYAVDRAGRDLPGWPAKVGGRVMASPAVANLAGDARPEVATLAEDGMISVHDASGRLVWSACNASVRTACRPGYGLHGQVSVADVDADGTQEVVSAGEHWMRVFDGRTGAVEREEAMGTVWAPVAAPTIASVGGRTWIVQHATAETRADGQRGPGDTQVLFVWTTGTALGRAEWPTFQGRAARGSALGATGPAPVVTRIDAAGPTDAALAVSAKRFAPDAAPFAVLSRADVFVDSLAGAPLTADAPLLLTPPGALDDRVAAELARALPASAGVYLLGGEAALSPAVAQSLSARGHRVTRLAGADRVGTALAVAEEVRRLHPGRTVALARASSPDANPTAAWADSVTGGAWAASAGVPVVVTPTEALHPAVASALSRWGVTRTVLLGGTAALSPAVEAAVPGAQRVGGADRAATAVAVVTDLWGGAPGRYTVIPGTATDGWAYGLAAAGRAADDTAPVLVAYATSVPSATAAFVRPTSCAAEPVRLELVGPPSAIGADAEAALRRAATAAC